MPELVDTECGHIQQGHTQHTTCVDNTLTDAVRLVDLEENPFTRCMVDVYEEVCQEQGCTGNGQYSVVFGAIVAGRHLLLQATGRLVPYGYRDYIQEYRRCLPLAQATLDNYGLEFYQDEEGVYNLRLRD